MLVQRPIIPTRKMKQRAPYERVEKPANKRAINLVYFNEENMYAHI